MYNDSMQPLTVKLEDFNQSAKAKVINIHDGDTIKVAIRIKKTRMKDCDLGYHYYIEDGYITLHTGIRFFGLNAPELKEEAGIVARDFLESYIAVGDILTLKTAVNPEDKYGRWLGILYKGRTNLNKLMLKSGNAAVLVY